MEVTAHAARHVYNNHGYNDNTDIAIEFVTGDFQWLEQYYKIWMKSVSSVLSKSCKEVSDEAIVAEVLALKQSNFKRE